MRKFIVRGGLFVLLPLLALELSVRALTLGPMAGVDRLYNVYEHVAPRLAAGDTLNCVFPGTSRIQAAIRPDPFSAVAEKDRGSPVSVVRASRGYSTLVMHLQGIEYLIDRRPDAMKNSLVFIEAPAGLVEPQHWNGRWARPEWPTLLSSNLSITETASLWWRSDDSVWHKALISAANYSDLVRYASVIRNKVHAQISSLVQVRGEEKGGDVENLPEGAGIRTDSAGVALARQKIIPSMRKWAHIDYKQPFLRWENSVLASLVGTVRAHGGEVILYTMPLSSPARSVIEESPRLRAERRRLKDWARVQSVPFLTLNFPHSDKDFPDLAHLRSSEAPAFTRQLAREYAAHVERSSVTGRANDSRRIRSE